MTGLLLNITGNGKGKSTSAFGTIIRAMGWDWRIALLQFVKGTIQTGEQLFFEKMKSNRFIYEKSGCGYSWTPGDHVGYARKGWERAKELLKSSELELLVLDELNIVLAENMLDVNEVIDALQNRHPNLNVIITGRSAPQNLLDICDLVSRIEAEKHPFENGLTARKGIDF